MNTMKIASAGILLLLLAGKTGFAANETWDGNVNGTWSNGGNWIGGAAPGAVGSPYETGDAAVFNAAETNNVLTIDQTGQTINSLLFTAATGSYTVGASGADAGNTLYFGTANGTRSSNTVGGNSNYISVGSSGTIDSVATAALSGPAATITIAAPIETEVSGGTLFIYNNASNGTGTGSAVLDITGNIASGNGSTGLALGGSNTNQNTISGVVGGANRIDLTLNAAGTWYLSNTANTYNGATTVNAGTLEIASIANVGTSSSIGNASLFNTTGNPSFTIVLGQNGSLAGTLDLVGTSSTYSSNRNIQLQNYLNNGGNGAIEVANAGTTLTLSGAILTNSGFTNTGGTVSQVNPATGNFTASLTLEGPGSGVLTGGFGGYGTGTSSSGSPSAASDIGSENALSLILSAGTGTWTLNNPASATQFRVGNLVAINGGTLLVAAGTTLDAGSYVVAGNNTAVVSVASGGTLSGAGTINADAATSKVSATGQFVSIASGGIMHVGADNVTTGTTLTVNSGLTTVSGSNLTFVLGAAGAHTTLALSGVSSGGADADAIGSGLTFTLNGSPTVGTYTNIITGLSSDPGNEGTWTITNAGDTGTFAYSSGGDISLDLTAIAAVPEPSAGALLIIALGLLPIWSRYIRRQLQC